MKKVKVRVHIFSFLADKLTIIYILFNFLAKTQSSTKTKVVNKSITFSMQTQTLNIKKSEVKKKVLITFNWF